MLTLLINGYSKEESDELFRAIQENFESVEIFGSSQNKVVKEILESKEKRFSPQGTQICMFVEFEEEDINSVLRLFPKSLKRPLFCALTESNSEWNLAYLGSHLIEERREMMEKMKEAQKTQ